MIPKIIHFCWLSNDEYPKTIKKCISTWKAKLPEYEFILWDTSKFDVNSTLWTKQAYEAKKYAFVADYIRFYAIYNYGGIYLDMDVEVLKKFDDLHNLPYFIGTQFDQLIEAAVIGSEKKSDWVLDCLNYYNNRAFIKENGELDLLILPSIMELQIKQTRKMTLLNSKNIDNISKLILNKDEFFLFPSDYFSPKNHQTRKVLISNNTYTIHHYDSAWLPFLSKIRLKFIRLIGVSNTEKIIGLLDLRKVKARLKK